MKKYILYDGVEKDFKIFATIEEAKKYLEEIIAEGDEYVEWFAGIEYSFVAELKYKIEVIKCDCSVKNLNCRDMKIAKV